METADWPTRFLALAEHIASWSKDPSTRVGCVIVDDERRILATGYNGFPRGVEDHPRRLADRPAKHLFTVHAEANAVAAAARSGVSLHGATAYVTHPCCAQCAALLIQAGVRSVVTRDVEMRPEWETSLEAAGLMLHEAGVGVDWVG